MSYFFRRETYTVCKHALLTYCSLLWLGLPQAHSCPKLDSNIYEWFVILLRILAGFRGLGCLQGTWVHIHYLRHIYDFNLCLSHYKHLFHLWFVDINLYTTSSCVSSFSDPFTDKNSINSPPLTLSSLTHTYTWTQSFSLSSEVHI